MSWAVQNQGPEAGSTGSRSDGVLDRVVDLDSAVAQRAEWARTGLRVVLTNGCFDLLHVGHVRSLASARDLGDRLIVALNDDPSTRALKGPGRPVVPAMERAEVLAALRDVDLVVPFSGTDAVSVVRALTPDVYVKGGDYDDEARRPPEADAASQVGADVVFVPYWNGKSTSRILRGIGRK